VSQFTGLWPFEHGALRVLEPLATPAETIAERYRAAGARTAGVMTNFIAKGELGFSRGFERWDESLALGHEGSTGSAAVAKLLAFADELLAEKERTPASLFLFALLFEPHYRYEDQPGPRFGPGYSDDRSYVGALTGDEDLPDLRRDRARLGADDIAFLRGRYQSEVSRVDRAIGELVAGLKARGLYDDALFVVTSDHGEEIMDRSWIGHTRTLFEELVRVPLVVRLPARAAGPAGSVVESPVSLVDLASTLLDLDGLAADGQGFGRGRSFRDLALERGPAVRRYLYLHSDFEPPLAGDAAAEKRTLLWGVLDAEKNLKWIVDRHPERAPSGMLFDLGADPGETYDVSGEREVPAGMRQLEALDLEQGP
jgi:arylsulfatase A-like enzyme